MIGEIECRSMYNLYDCYETLILFYVNTLIT